MTSLGEVIKMFEKNGIPIEYRQGISEGNLEEYSSEQLKTLEGNPFSCNHFKSGESENVLLIYAFNNIKGCPRCRLIISKKFF